MPNDLSIFEKLKGKRLYDVELPNESGKVDPRVKGTSVREALGKIRPSLQALKDIREKQRKSSD